MIRGVASGLMAVNLVDEVTQFQFIGSVERIAERFLLPVLEALIQTFPFTVLGFHSDNGSEYVNKQVAALLEKLHVQEFTKSRARRTNDNALVASKNGSVVRKHLGYAHIPGRFAQTANDFTRNVLSPTSTSTGLASSPPMPGNGFAKATMRPPSASTRPGLNCSVPSTTPKTQPPEGLSHLCPSSSFQDWKGLQ